MSKSGGKIIVIGVDRGPRVILAGRRINDDMGRWIADQIQTPLGLSSRRVLSLGVTFKRIARDVRHKGYAKMPADAPTGRIADGGVVADFKGMWRTLDLPDGVRRWSL